MSTAKGRLPDFIIIGERRSGTTSLIYKLRQHPEIGLHKANDLNYFVDDIVRGRKDLGKGKANKEDWWENHSAEGYAAEFIDVADKPVVGEKSADYLFWKPAHKRMKQILKPDTKFIVTVRNPTQRAWSQYVNELGKGREILTFKKAIETEHERCSNSDFAMSHFSYAQRGNYVDNIEAFLDHFNSEQLFVMTLDQMKKDPDGTMRAIHVFLGVTPGLGLAESTKVFNKNWATVPYDFVQRSPFLAASEKFFVRGLRYLINRVESNGYRRRQRYFQIESFFRRTKDDLKLPVSVKKSLDIKFADYKPSLQQFLIDKGITSLTSGNQTNS